jgi:hypothetical protein
MKLILAENQTNDFPSQNKYSLRIVDKGVDLNQIDNNSIIEVNELNQLLHVACNYADIDLILYALALNADRNSIIDRIDVFNGESQSHSQAHLGYTPLIKAVHAVSSS